jgi:hypothetical protein
MVNVGFACPLTKPSNLRFAKNADAMSRKMKGDVLDKTKALP